MVGESMNLRFDVFQKQDDRLIKWVGTAENLEDLEKLVRTNSTDASQDDYVIFRSAHGVTEAFTEPLSERTGQPALEKCDSRKRC
jgi:hypothetical protein